MKTGFFLILAMFSFLHKGIAQDTLFKPLYSVIVTQLPTRLHQCSRSVPAKIESFWVPSQTDIENLESNFKSIYALRAKVGGIIGAKVERLELYSFQYLGVTINGERYIYINAFWNNLLEQYKNKKNDLSRELVVVCDGGNSFWGALYNIKTMQFSDLAFNGFA